MIQKLILIDDQLPARLAALETAAGITFEMGTVAQILADSEEDQISEKHYALYESSSVRITAQVDAYEPDDIFIRVEASDKVEAKYLKLLDELFPRY